FKALEFPSEGINQYLTEVYLEAEKRGYKFDRNKINWEFTPVQIHGTKGQIIYEMEHLLKKLQVRDLKKYEEMNQLNTIGTHPMFTQLDGEIEAWEIV